MSTFGQLITMVHNIVANKLLKKLLVTLADNINNNNGKKTNERKEALKRMEMTPAKFVCIWRTRLRLAVLGSNNNIRLEVICFQRLA